MNKTPLIGTHKKLNPKWVIFSLYSDLTFIEIKFLVNIILYSRINTEILAALSENKNKEQCIPPSLVGLDSWLPDSLEA